MNTLIEHFDTVQILATKYSSEENKTHMISMGRGDILARAHHLRITLRVNDEQTTELLRGNQGNETW